MKSHHFRYMFLGFALQAFLALILTASIASSGSFFLGFTEARLIVLALLLLLGIVLSILAIYFYDKPQLEQKVDQFIKVKLANRSGFSLIFIFVVLLAVCSAFPLIPLLPVIGKGIAAHLWGSDHASWIIAELTRLSPLLLIIALLSLEIAIFLGIRYKSDLLSSGRELLSNIKFGINRLDAWAQSHLKSVLAPGPLALIITGIFFLLFLRCLRIGYGATDDDLQIISLLSGYGGNAPTPFSIYPSFGLAFPLMLLYHLHTSLNWFMLFLAVIIFVSTWALLYAFIGLKNSRKANRLLSVILILACTSYLLMRLTFTSASGYAIVAGLILLLFSLTADEQPKLSFLGTGVVLVVLGSLVRPESIFIPLIIFFPCWIANIGSPRRQIYFATFGITVILVMAGFILNNAEYASNSAWNDFIAYSNARSDIQDTARINNILQVNDSAKLARIHWSRNDVKMFGMWFFSDLKIYSYENLQFLDNSYSSQRQFPQETWNDFIAFMGNTYTLPYIALLISTFLLLLSSPPRKSHFISTIISLICAIGVFFYLGWNMKLADRITFPAITALSLVNLLYYCLDYPPKDAARNKFILSTLTLIGVAVMIYSVVIIYGQDLSQSEINKERQHIYSSAVADIDAMIGNGKIPSGALFLGPNRAFPIEWTNPFILALPNFHYVIMDWITNSPTFEQFIHKYGIQSLVSALYQRNDVYLFAREKDIPIVEEYILEHDGIKVSKKIIYSSITDSIFDYHDSHLYQLSSK